MCYGGGSITITMFYNYNDRLRLRKPRNKLEVKHNKHNGSYKY